MVLHYIFTVFCVLAGIMFMRGAHLTHKNKMGGDGVMTVLAIIAFAGAAIFYFTAH